MSGSRLSASTRQESCLNGSLRQKITYSCLAVLILAGVGALVWWFSPANSIPRYERMSLLDLRRHLETAPNDASGWHVMGLRLAHDGDAGLAEGALRHAVELKPGDFEAATALGELLTSVGKYPEAFQLLKQVASSRPTYAPAHRALGILYRRRGSYHHAVEEFHAVLQSDPKDGDVWYQTAHCYWNMQQVANARNALTEALKIDPGNPAFITLNGNILAAVGNFPEGVAQISRAVEIAPDNLNANASLATLLLQHGSSNEDLVKAEKSLQSIEKANPEYALLPYFHGQLESKRGNWLEAIRHLENALKVSPGYNPVYLALSQAYRRVKRSGEADKLQQIYVTREATQKEIENLKTEMGGARAKRQTLRQAGGTAVQTGRVLRGSCEPGDLQSSRAWGEICPRAYRDTAENHRRDASRSKLRRPRRELPSMIRMRSKTYLAPFALLFALGLAGCPSNPARPVVPQAGVTPAQSSSSGSSAIQFEDATQKSGVDFELSARGKTPLTILDTSGGGCAFLDYDQDGWPDILLVGPGRASLFHNERNGTFKDATSVANLPQRRWMGCAVGDYDGDGLPDIFLTGYRCAALLRNRGGGVFEDTTKASGIDGLSWSMSAAFADFNGDGRLDLFVGQYVEFNEKSQQLCALGSNKTACGPEIYPALSGKLFLNLGGGRFKAAPWKDTGKTWGALATDLMGNGKPSLYLANDMMQGDLWVQKPEGWKNIGVASATAYDGRGLMQGGMGVDSADYDRDGKIDLLVTNYYMQAASLYHNDGEELFTVTSDKTGLGPPTMPNVKFGGGFADFDNDGWQDIFIASGHVRDNIKQHDSSQSYPQPMQLFRNENGRFTEASEGLKSANLRSVVGRGVSFGDYDGDGKIDVLICNLEGKAVLLRNVSKAGHWLNVRLKSSGKNRFGIGAIVSLKGVSPPMIREIRTSGSVLSAFDPCAHFGLGASSGPVTIEIRWPDGKKQIAIAPGADREITVFESKN